MSEKKKRVTVNAPFFRSRPKKAPNLEKYKFFEISRKMGSHFSKFAIFVGVFICLVSSVYILTFTGISLHNPLLINAMMLLGIINFFFGLLLLVIE